MSLYLIVRRVISGNDFNIARNRSSVYLFTEGSLVNKFEQRDPTYPHGDLHKLGPIGLSPDPLPARGTHPHGDLPELFKLVHFGKRAVGLRLKKTSCYS